MTKFTTQDIFFSSVSLLFVQICMHSPLCSFWIFTLLIFSMSETKPYTPFEHLSSFFIVTFIAIFYTRLWILISASLTSKIAQNYKINALVLGLSSTQQLSYPGSLLNVKKKTCTCIYSSWNFISSHPKPKNFL